MSISSSPTPSALRVELKPSRCFCALLAGIALLALSAVFYAELTWPLRLLLTALVLAYGGRCWQSQARQRGLLQWRSMWLWRGADGVERALRLRHVTVWPGLIVLVFCDIERRRSFALTLLPDSFVSADDARRLRVVLNHFPVFDSAARRD